VTCTHPSHAARDELYALRLNVGSFATVDSALTDAADAHALETRWQRRLPADVSTNRFLASFWSDIPERLFVHLSLELQAAVSKRNAATAAVERAPARFTLMRFDGESWDAVVASFHPMQRPMPFKYTIAVISDVAEVLAAAHEERAVCVGVDVATMMVADAELAAYRAVDADAAFFGTSAVSPMSPHSVVGGGGGGGAGAAVPRPWTPSGCASPSPRSRAALSPWPVRAFATAPRVTSVEFGDVLVFADDASRPWQRSLSLDALHDVAMQHGSAAAAAAGMWKRGEFTAPELHEALLAAVGVMERDTGVVVASASSSAATSPPQSSTSSAASSATGAAASDGAVSLDFSGQLSFTLGVFSLSVLCGRHPLQRYPHVVRYSDADVPRPADCPPELVALLVSLVAFEPSRRVGIVDAVRTIRRLRDAAYMPLSATLSLLRDQVCICLCTSLSSLARALSSTGSLTACLLHTPLSLPRLE
jgi:hypothetical protein